MNQAADTVSEGLGTSGSERDCEQVPPHSHNHNARLNLTPADRRRVRIVLAAIVIPVAVATLIGCLLLWPSAERPAVHTPLTSGSIVHGQIAEVGGVDKLGNTSVTMTLDDKGVTVPLHVPFDIVSNGLEPGDRVSAIFNAAAIDSGTPYIFVDFERGIPLAALAALYVLVVALVARRKGLAAILGLAASLAVVAFFMLPALILGKPPILVVIVGAGAMMFFSIYCAHGISIRTTTAVIGTLCGLVITGILAGVCVRWANLTGTLSDGAVSLYGQLGYLQMNHILVCGIILAGLGALNDVTISQVSAVWELHGANPSASRFTIFRQAMTIGRDHIASTVYTLAFAYVGSALPLLMSAAMIERGFLDLMVVGEIAEEIVRTLVPSIGLVLAIPMTTAIATRLAPVAPTRGANQ
ncbi:YibE/F family protein [Trueperella sp. LYQ143]|uniref:YibE/F family protein n=1 Tax=unclassified Trueperella TaxID=2630174 RepID=UPI003983D972